MLSNISSSSALITRFRSKEKVNRKEGNSPQTSTIQIPEAFIQKKMTLCVNHFGAVMGDLTVVEVVC